MEEHVIPFRPTPVDVVIVDTNDISLKRVKLERNRSHYYYALLRKYWPVLHVHDNPPSDADYERMTTEIIDTIVKVNKGRFLKLVGVGPDNLGLCTVLGPLACRRKVMHALRRIHSRFKNAAAVAAAITTTTTTTPKAIKSKSHSKKKQSSCSATTNNVVIKKEEVICIDDSSVSDGDASGEDDATTCDSDDDDKDSDDEEEDEDEDTEFEETEYKSTPVEDQQKRMIPFAPKPNDVVATNDRGWHTRHPGNIEYRKLLEKNLSKYVKLQQDKRQHDKAAVSKEIVDLIHNRGGRFLKWNNRSKVNRELCMVMTRNEAVTKLQIAFHAMRSRVAAPLSVGHHQQQETSPAESDNESESDENSEKRISKPRAKRPKVHREHPLIAPRNIAVGGWTFERLYDDGGDDDDDDGDAAPPPASGSSTTGQKLYGCPENEFAMRQWLNENKLPQSVGDVLLSFGVRDITDVALLVESNADELQRLATLDVIKLKRAAQLL